ncbi:MULTISPECIES: ribonuclease P protein component [Leucobacter]|uniref:Ribonuclease P protein component n=2 Tax=Leucobacter TaxID=55968 RepID=A0ABP5MYZ7_9MICO|nr:MULTISPECIES: ribonuclease P protein component [Leucobacter]MBS3182653.1 ribonuclease P protein component [Leucobacter manosquensis]
MPARRNRVTRGEDYRQTVRAGRRVGGALCITHAVLRSPEDAARFGFIISKAVGNAVTRNLVRRRMKSIVEQRLRNGATGVDVVFRALPAAADAPFAELEREINRALDRVERRQASTETRS